jgi:hypothetical protein
MSRASIRQRLAAATIGQPGWMSGEFDLFTHARRDIAALLAVADAAAMVGETRLEYDDGICVDCHGWPSGRHDEGCAVPRLLDALAALEAA